RAAAGRRSGTAARSAGRGRTRPRPSPRRGRRRPRRARPAAGSRGGGGGGGGSLRRGGRPPPRRGGGGARGGGARVLVPVRRRGGRKGQSVCDGEGDTAPAARVIAPAGNSATETTRRMAASSRPVALERCEMRSVTHHGTPLGTSPATPKRLGLHLRRDGERR